MVADHDGRWRRKISLVHVRDHFVPTLLTCFCVERYKVIIRRFHEQVVVPHSQTAIADMRAAFGFPEVMPELVAIARVQRPSVIRHCEIQGAIDLKNGRFDRAAVNSDISWTFSSDNDLRFFMAVPPPALARFVHPWTDAGHPRERRDAAHSFDPLASGRYSVYRNNLRCMSARNP